MPVVLDKPHLTKREAARMLGVCQKTVVRLIKRRRLEAVRVSERCTLIDQGSLEELIAAKDAGREV